MLYFKLVNFETVNNGLHAEFGVPNYNKVSDMMVLTRNSG